MFVHVIVWKADDALLTPLSALFRKGDAWAVYKADTGRAKLVIVDIAERNLNFAATRSGLAAGDKVIVHPNDRIVDDAAIVERRSLQ